MNAPHSTRRQWLMQGLGLAAAAAAPGWAMAASASGYPNKPVRVIVPFAAGGTTDVVARLVLQKLGEQVGQSFIVENKGGAGGSIGTEQVARSAPDGYTLLINTAGAQTLSPVIYKVGYEALASFEPVTHICDVGFIVIARKDLPANNMKELIALARGPQPLSMSSGSSMINLMSEEFKRIIGAPETINAQYKGTAPQMQAVVSGEVDFSLDSFAAVEMIRAGRVKALGVVMPQRAASFPDVPTLREQGIEGMDFASWAGLLAPKGTPKEAVAYLAHEMDKVMQLEDVQAKLRSYNYTPRRTTPEEFGKMIAADNERWKRIVKETGFKVS
ncbi:tripartite tricarboxylate transporter substrate binding protein [Melaminivora jejuensis]|uniref:Bug family tripartite tricarboxylate transporter substrate binding protein n=1 Tax=Melaminivora jejuensis TaxID=1267217 RepID=UPI001E3BEB8D|nr:tripartite tricarboxylate transporter substrate binding protein [Melaminivora jejuensis]UHJ65492.1 tripartite tricarboxylate transporter substrate binding protein [Melaminivora jejuensis]